MYDSVSTPALLVDHDCLEQNTLAIKKLCSDAGATFLYAMKPQSLHPVLDVVAQNCDGLAVSSLFEAQYAQEHLSSDQTIHYTSPGLRPDEIGTIAQIVDHMAFNSVSQWEMFSPKAAQHTSCGLRINPHYSVLKDKRYDPCKPHSKLGASVDYVMACYEDNPKMFDVLTGIHLHTNCDGEDLSDLKKTIDILEGKMAKALSHLEWINLGGGYLFKEAEDHEPFYQCVEKLVEVYKLKVFVEPGAAVVREAGCFVSSVIDLFQSDGKTVAVLDTSVNHMPEVFEYQFSPDVVGDTEDGKYKYILAGGSCLAGDVFGDYAFDTPLEIGSKVIFSDMGAYSNVKAHMFNGINLPKIYTCHGNKSLNLHKEFTYNDFLNMNGA